MSLLTSIIPRPIKSQIKKAIAAQRNRKLYDAALEKGSLKLHLACGPRVLPEWLNVDSAEYPGAMQMWLPSGLSMFPDRCADFVYCSHMLHYLDYPGEVSDFVRQIFRVLKPDGVFRFVVPGIERIIRAYVADDAEFFREQENHHPAWATTKLDHLMCALNAKHADGSHKYGYDFETAQTLMKSAGFKRVANSAFNESEFEPLRMDYKGKDLSLFVDAVK